MARRILLVFVVAAFSVSLTGCGGPGEVTVVPDSARVGLGRPGGDGPGHFKDPLTGEDMPIGLAPVPN